MNNYQVYEYWKDKKIKNIYIVSYPDEPSCWACNKKIQIKGNTIESIWKNTKKHLERCHIVPEALNGKTIPSNLFLLCKKCHKESPDTVHKESFFNWVYNQRISCLFGYNIKIFKNELEQALNSFNLKPEIITKYNVSELLKQLDNEINDHAGTISVSTVIYGLLNIINKHENKINSEENRIYLHENKISSDENRMYLHDIKLTLKAKGLLTYLLDINKNNITAKRLSNRLKESEKTITNTLKELIDNGYITREQNRLNNGTFGNYIYNFYQEPQQKNFTLPDSKKVNSDNENNLPEEPEEKDITLFYLNRLQKRLNTELEYIKVYEAIETHGKEKINRYYKNIDKLFIYHENAWRCFIDSIEKNILDKAL